MYIKHTVTYADNICKNEKEVRRKTSDFILLCRSRIMLIQHNWVMFLFLKQDNRLEAADCKILFNIHSIFLYALQNNASYILIFYGIIWENVILNFLLLSTAYVLSFFVTSVKVNWIDAIISITASGWRDGVC